MVKIEIVLKSFLVRVQVYIIFFFLSKLRDKFSGVAGKIFLFFVPTKYCRVLCLFDWTLQICAQEEWWQDDRQESADFSFD